MDNLNHHKIDDYLRGKMNAEDRKAFELLLQPDADLTTEFKLRQEASQMLEAVRDQRMRDRLDNIHEQQVGSKPGKPFAKIFGSVLIVVLLAALGYYFLVYKAKDTHVTPDRIYAQYFEPYPLHIASRGKETTLELQQVNTLYKNKKYKEALPLLDNLLTQSSNSNLKLAAGISALETGLYNGALEYFNSLIDAKDPLYESQATWYAAMTALKLKDTRLAKSYLKSLTSSGTSFKKEESLKILKTLE